MTTKEHSCTSGSRQRRVLSPPPSSSSQGLDPAGQSPVRKATVPSKAENEEEEQQKQACGESSVLLSHHYPHRPVNLSLRRQSQPQRKWNTYDDLQYSSYASDDDDDDDHTAVMDEQSEKEETHKKYCNDEDEDENADENHITDTHQTLSGQATMRSSVSLDPKPSPTPFPASYRPCLERAFGEHVDLYRDVLQVERTASDHRVRIAYFKRGRQVLSPTTVLENHSSSTRHQQQPTFAELSLAAKNRFQAVSMAYEILSNPTWRAFYDQYGLGTSTSLNTDMNGSQAGQSSKHHQDSTTDSTSHDESSDDNSTTQGQASPPRPASSSSSSFVHTLAAEKEDALATRTCRTLASETNRPEGTNVWEVTVPPCHDFDADPSRRPRAHSTGRVRITATTNNSSPSRSRSAPRIRWSDQVEELVYRQHPDEQALKAASAAANIARAQAKMQAYLEQLKEEEGSASQSSPITSELGRTTTSTLRPMSNPATMERNHDDGSTGRGEKEEDYTRLVTKNGRRKRSKKKKKVIVEGHPLESDDPDDTSWRNAPEHLQRHFDQLKREAFGQQRQQQILNAPPSPERSFGDQCLDGLDASVEMLMEGWSLSTLELEERKPTNNSPMQQKSTNEQPSSLDSEQSHRDTSALQVPSQSDETSTDQTANIFAALQYSLLDSYKDGDSVQSDVACLMPMKHDQSCNSSNYTHNNDTHLESTSAIVPSTVSRPVDHQPLPDVLHTKKPLLSEKLKVEDIHSKEEALVMELFSSLTKPAPSSVSKKGLPLKKDNVQTGRPLLVKSSMQSHGSNNGDSPTGKSPRIREENDEDAISRLMEALTKPVPSGFSEVENKKIATSSVQTKRKITSSLNDASKSTKSKSISKNGTASTALEDSSWESMNTGPQQSFSEHWTSKSMFGQPPKLFEASQRTSSVTVIRKTMFNAPTTVTEAFDPFAETSLDQFSSLPGAWVLNENELFQDDGGNTVSTISEEGTLIGSTKSFHEAPDPEGVIVTAPASPENLNPMTVRMSLSNTTESSFGVSEYPDTETSFSAFSTLAFRRKDGTRDRCGSPSSVRSGFSSLTDANGRGAACGLPVGILKNHSNRAFCSVAPEHVRTPNLRAANDDKSTIEVEEHKVEWMFPERVPSTLADDFVNDEDDFVTRIYAFVQSVSDDIVRCGETVFQGKSRELNSAPGSGTPENVFSFLQFLPCELHGAGRNVCAKE